MPVHGIHLNSQAVLPYGLLLGDVRTTLEEAHTFIYSLNRVLYRQIGQRIEDILMPATFSGMLSEFIVRQLSVHSTTLTRNLYHNGHPDLIPVGRYPGDAIQYGHDGIGVKTSRYSSGWQGHNPENIWLMVFRYRNDPYKPEKDLRPLEEHVPFQIVEVLAAKLEKSDWSAQGRGSGSRRTPTASVVATGTAKLRANWLYRVPDLSG
jgi:hypothetical protein